VIYDCIIVGAALPAGERRPCVGAVLPTPSGPARRINQALLKEDLEVAEQEILI